jgi:hypothetical protein
MFPDISQSILNARTAEWLREAEQWRLVHEARLTGPRGLRGTARRLSARRAGGPRQARHAASPAGRAAA